jgi:hypothetical protein
VFFALVALAFASQTPQVTYTSPIKQKGKPKKGKAVPVTYNGILTIREPDGTQPPTAPKTTLYFAKGFIQNSKYFPKCKQSDIDGKQTSAIPKKCKKAIVGSGVAKSVAGPTPGTPPLAALSETLSVTAYNGTGNTFLLALNTTSGSVPIQNRVIPGKLGKGGGKYAYTLTFLTPANLQSLAGQQIALTDFNVVTSSRTITAKVKGKKQKVSYLMLANCPKSHKLPVQAKVFFNQDNGQPGGPVVTSTTTTSCK